MYPSSKQDCHYETFVDAIWDWGDELMLAGQFDIINQWLKDIVVSKCDIDFMLTALTLTLPARSKLDYRAEFFNKVEIEIIERHGSPFLEDGLLKGLE